MIFIFSWEFVRLGFSDETLHIREVAHGTRGKKNLQRDLGPAGCENYALQPAHPAPCTFVLLPISPLIVR
jgi:hypothetical protein